MTDACEHEGTLVTAVEEAWISYSEARRCGGEEGVRTLYDARGACLSSWARWSSDSSSSGNLTLDSPRILRRLV
jgi:hypothetical protein